jgi:hypothetical protein
MNQTTGTIPQMTYEQACNHLREWAKQDIDAGDAEAVDTALAEAGKLSIQCSTLLSELERRYVQSLNAILASPPGRARDADVNRWRGHAEAYRQVCELIRRDAGMEAGEYTSQEWRTANGVYTDEDIAEFRRIASR